MATTITPFEEQLHDLIAKNFTLDIWPVRKIKLIHVPLEWSESYWLIKNQAGQEELFKKQSYDLDEAKRLFTVMKLVYDYFGQPADHGANDTTGYLLGRIIAEYVKKNPARYPATIHSETLVVMEPELANRNFWPYYFVPVMQAIACPHEADYYSDFSLSREAYRGFAYGDMDTDPYSDTTCPSLREIAKNAHLEKPCVVFKFFDDGMVDGKIHAKLLTVHVPHAGQLPLIVGGAWHLVDGREKSTDKCIRHEVHFDWRQLVGTAHYKGTGYGGDAAWSSGHFSTEETDEIKAAETALKILGYRFLGADQDGFEDWCQYHEALAFHYC